MKKNFFTALCVAAVLMLMAGAAFAAPEFRLQFGGSLTEDHPHTMSHREFARRIEERTGGRVVIEVFPSNQLGAERERVEQLQMGTLDFTKTMTAIVANFSPNFNVLSLPFIFTNQDHVYAVLNGPIGQNLMKELESANLKGVMWYWAGSRSIYNSRRPIKTPDDMQGLKLRVPENPVLIDTINAMGGTGVPISVAEIYTSIRQGVVDGAENSPLFYYEQKHHEIAPFYSYTNHSLTPDIVTMSLITWNSLPEDIQNIIMETAAEIQEFEKQKWAELEQEFVDRLVAEGAKLNQLDDPAAFQPLMKGVWEKHAGNIDPALIDAIVNTQY